MRGLRHPVGPGDVLAVARGENAGDHGGGLAVAGDDDRIVARVADAVDNVAELGAGLVDAYLLYARIIHVVNVVKQEASSGDDSAPARRRPGLSGEARSDDHGQNW